MKADEANRLAVYLMAKHGLTDKGWRFRFNKRMNAAGMAAERRNGEKWIELSLPFIEVNSDENIKQTILHEIAHAQRGIKHGHDLQWKLTARSIGANGETHCNSSVIAPRGSVGGSADTAERRRKFIGVRRRTCATLARNACGSTAGRG